MKELCLFAFCFIVNIITCVKCYKGSVLLNIVQWYMCLVSLFRIFEKALSLSSPHKVNFFNIIEIDVLISSIVLDIDKMVLISIFNVIYLVYLFVPKKEEKEELDVRA